MIFRIARDIDVKPVARRVANEGDEPALAMERQVVERNFNQHLIFVFATAHGFHHATLGVGHAGAQITGEAVLMIRSQSFWQQEREILGTSLLTSRLVQITNRIVFTCVAYRSLRLARNQAPARAMPTP